MFTIYYHILSATLDKDQKFTLTMAPPPELFVGYNKTVVLGCASSGSLNTMFHWTADGSVIADSNGIFPFLPLTEIYEFIKPTNLRIKRATNPTTFKCLFRSDQGLLVAESVVHVIGKIFLHFWMHFCCTFVFNFL